MKYDFSKVLINQQRKSMQVSDDNAAPWTAALALSAALLVETNENVKTKLDRFNLWLKIGEHINPSDEAAGTDYSAKEVETLTAAAMTYPAIFAGQLVKILDQK
jgi:hypothetical protein